jgi:PAS domain S-box-containing protein
MPPTQRTILILEDSAEDAATFRRYLERERSIEYVCRVASTSAEGLELCHSMRPDAILLDYRLPDVNGLAFLASLMASHGPLAFAVIMVTGVGNEAVAVEAMKLGAQDYLVKEYDIQGRLLHAVDNAIKKVELQRQVERQRRELEASNQQLRQALEAREASEAQLLMALGAAGMATWEWDLATNQVRWGEGLATMLGIPDAEFGGNFAAFQQLVHPDDLGLVRLRLDQALRGNAPYQIEFRMLRPDGGLRWTATRGTVVRDSQGTPIRIIGVDMDVTERKQSEAELRESEERYRALVTATSHIVWRTSVTGAATFATSAWQDLTGQSEAQMLGWGWIDAVHPDDREQAMARWQEAIATRTLYESEFRVRAQDGSYRNFYTRGVPIVAADGSVREWIGANTDITLRKQAVAELRESEERYRALVTATSDLVWHANASGEMLFISPHWHELTGQSTEELRGWGWTAVVHPDDIAPAMARWREALAAQSLYENEFRVRARDGSYRRFKGRGVPIIADDGSVREWIGYSSDITERRQIADQLRRSEAQFKTLVENADDIIARFDRDLRHLYVSPAIERVTSLPQSAFVGKTNRELGMPEQLCELWDIQLRSVFETGHKGILEFEYESSEGILQYQSTLIPELSADGVVETVMSIGHDVTMYKQAEARLRFLSDASKVLTSSLDYRVTLEQIARLAIPYLGDACVIDLIGDNAIADTLVAHTNPQQEQLLREICRSYPPALNGNHPATQVLRTGQSVAADRVSQEMINQNITSEAQRILVQRLPPLSFMMVPLTVRGQSIGVISLYATQAPRNYSANDLELLEELARRAAVALDNAQLYQEAQEAIREREAFLAIASHEVKNPLTALLGRSQMLRRRLARRDDSTRELSDTEIIIDSAERIDRLLSELLDAARVVGGQLSIAPVPLDLGSLVQQVVARIQPSAPNHQIAVAERATGLAIAGDADRLEQVFQNLLSNAIKYSPAGGAIDVEIALQDARARITVSDSGLGIPADALPNLFKRFYRVSRASTQQITGTGIGLYVVKEIVTSHGGTVDVRSTEGAGSSFTVYLPLARLQEQSTG